MFERWLNPVLSALFPDRCLICGIVLPAGAGREPLCSGCIRRFSPAGYICPVCEQLLAETRNCCSTADLPLQGLFALSYEGDWRLMLHRFKFAGQKNLARPLGSWLGRLLSRQPSPWTPVDLVVPVPLHRRRERERGYNQTMLMAKYLSRELGCSVYNILEKTRDTPAQAGMPRHLRRQNVEGVFAVSFIP